MGTFVQHLDAVIVMGKTNVQELKVVILFPMEDRKRQQAWLKNISRDKWSPTIHSKTCGDHFSRGLNGYYFKTFFL